MRKGLLIILMIFTAVNIVLAGGAQETPADPGTDVFSEQQDTTGTESGPIVVTDTLGRKVTLDGPAKTVAWTHYSTTEALKILDAWELVVAGGPAVSDERLYPGFADMPKLFTDNYQQYNPNLEVLIDINPDLLIVEVLPLQGLDELLESLDGIINVVCIACIDPEKLNESYTILGKLLDREEEAAVYVDWVSKLESDIAAKTAAISEDEKTTYFFKTGTGDVKQIITYTDEMNTGAIKDIVTGGRNIAGSLPSRGGWIHSVDQEWLVEQDYDVLFIADVVPGAFGSRAGGPSLAAAHRAAVMRSPAFADSRAVKEGRVYVMSEIFSGANMPLSYPYIAKALYPELFADLDPVAIHQEYVTKFLKSDAVLKETGVYFYPLLK